MTVEEWFKKNYTDFCGQMKKKVKLFLFLIRHYEKNMYGREEI
jgi:hypothetical protein